MCINFVKQSYNGMVCFAMDKSDYRKLEKKRLAGCPFENYSAMDLLRDLIKKYSGRMEKGIEYSIGDFLTLCDNKLVERYRWIYEA